MGARKKLPPVRSWIAAICLLVLAVCRGAAAAELAGAGPLCEAIVDLSRTFSHGYPAREYLRAVEDLERLARTAGGEPRPKGSGRSSARCGARRCWPIRWSAASRSCSSSAASTGRTTTTRRRCSRPARSTPAASRAAGR